MSLQVHNTLGNKRENFEPIEKGKVKMYVCGPTVYSYLHVGNFRGAVFFNFVRNWLEHLGYKVTYIYNFTDVDDKIIQQAQKENVEPREISEKYIKEFKKDFNALELTAHSANPKVTDHMEPIIKLIEELLKNQKAYVVGGEVLFHVKEFSQYGKLSGRKVDELRSGVRIEVDPNKKDAMDFTLWKPSKEGEPSWDSPWGKGRPGWHIECSAMNRALLGEQIDIHGGGIDLVFPHHENEIAQSEGASGKSYVKYWLHNNMFTFAGAKMSKSLGNIRTMRSFLEIYPAEVFKYLVLSVHYRSVTDFSENTIDQSISALARIYSTLSLVRDFDGESSDRPSEELRKKIEEATGRFEKAINDDFNTPKGFAAIFDLVRFVNQKIKRGMKPNSQRIADCQAIQSFFQEKGKLLALFQQEPQRFLVSLDDMLLKKKGLERTKVNELVKRRKDHREAKDYPASDKIRDELVEMGIELQDTPTGTYWEVAK